MSTKYGLTETYLQEQVKDVNYQRYGDTGTLCVLTLKKRLHCYWHKRLY